MGRKDKRIKELEAEVESLKATVRFLNERLVRHYREEEVRIRSEMLSDSVRIAVSPEKPKESGMNPGFRTFPDMGEREDGR